MYVNTAGELQSGSIKPSRTDRILNGFICVTLIVILLLCLYPLYLIVIASVSDPTAINNGQVIFFPKGLNFSAYSLLLETKTIWIGYRNSLFYTIVGTALQMAVTTACAFSLSRKGLPGRRFFALFFLFPMYFSGGLIPTYLVVKNLGLVNTVWALIVPFLVGPYNVVICRSYMENSIPEDLFESAKIDGASMKRCFMTIAVPLSVPVLAVMILNFALGHWNSYMNALIYISDDNIQTLQVFIKRIVTTSTTTLGGAGGRLMVEEVVEQARRTQLLKYAVVIVSSLPMVLLYPLIQRYFIQGIMIGAIKG